MCFREIVTPSDSDPALFVGYNGMDASIPSFGRGNLMTRFSFFIATVLLTSISYQQYAMTKKYGEKQETGKKEPRADDQVSPLKAGEVTTVADGINGGTGGLNIDKQGNLYTADFGWRLDGKGKGGHQIFKVTPKGKVSLFYSSLRGGSGNTFDASGNLFQSSIGSGTVSKIGANGKGTVFCKKGLKNPVGLVFNSKGDLFACSCGSNSIQRIDSNGKATTFSKGKLFNVPNGITVSPDDRLFVCNFGNGDVIEINKEGEPKKLTTIPGGGNGHLIFHKGFLYVLARNDCSVFRVSLKGEVVRFAGTGKRGKQNGPGLKATFSLPNSLIVSNDQKFLYVNETSPTSGDPRILGPTRIRKIELLPAAVKPE